MLPNPGSFAELDPTVRDRFGLPVLRFHWKWGEHEIAAMAHARSALTDVFESVGGTLTTDSKVPMAQPLRRIRTRTRP